MADLWPENRWLAGLAALAGERLAHHGHGDLPRWRQALHTLPAVTAEAVLDEEIPRLGQVGNNSDGLRNALMAFHPWRKGPLQLAGLTIDTEWRSDWKWQRLAPHIELHNQRVLDIGCGNGYFGLRMLGAGARLVVGVDPTLLFVMQWLACTHFSGPLANFVLPLGIEDLPPVSQPSECFDTVFSMGVLYHRKDHLAHLQQLRRLLVPGGTLVLETLVLPPDQRQQVLVPENRYARMRNVWAVPACDVLLDWLRQSGYQHTELVDVTATSLQEQRSTDWMQFESLDKSLDGQDPSRTLEGHPAPVRAIIIARN